MSSSTTPLATYADQFEDLSRELFLRFRRAAKVRLAANASPAVTGAPHEAHLPTQMQAPYQEASSQGLLVH